MVNKINIFFVLFMIMSRLIPHPPDFTPMIVLSLFALNFNPKKTAVLLVLLSQLVSDFILAYGHHYAWLGNWSWFTYSGLGLIILCFRFNLFSVVAATVLYWVWTNLGVFILSGLYSHTSMGLSACYIAALPFLGLNIAGSVVYYKITKLLDTSPSNRLFSPNYNFFM